MPWYKGAWDDEGHNKAASSKPRNQQSHKQQQSGFEDIPAVERCLDRSHEPPTHLHIPQGKRYRHVCPSCGYTVVLQPPQITC